MAMSLAEAFPPFMADAVAFALRAAMGAYVIYMARLFYADPAGYIRRWMRWLPESEWAQRFVRAWAAFCVWGGCFIFATACATQLLNLHGLTLLAILLTLASVATYLLLPKNASPIGLNSTR